MQEQQRLVVLGGSGMLGSMCIAVLRLAGFDLLAPSSHELDVTDAAAMSGYMSRHAPALVLNCAAVKDFRNVSDWPRGFAVNATAPLILSLMASQRGFRVIQISTDAVFDSSPGPSDETEHPRPAGPYAVSKRAGEPNAALVLRLSVIGPGRAAYPALLERLKRGNTVHASKRELWNGLTSLEVAERLALHIRSGSPASGIRHVFGPGLDRLHLARGIVTQFGFPGQVIETDAVKDLRLSTKWDDFAPIPVSASLPERLARLREMALRFQLWD